MVVSIDESTDTVSPVQRWAFWKKATMAAVDSVRLDARGPFSARRSITGLAMGTLVDTVSDPVSYRRSTHNIARDGDNSVCLMMLHRGHGVVEQLGTAERAFKASEAELFDLARPYAVAMTSTYREIRLDVPRGLFGARVGRIEDLVGFRIGASPLATLFTYYLAGFSDALPELSRAEADAGLDGALHLLSGLVAARTGARRSDGDILDDKSMLRLAERHIEMLLSDPRLDVAGLGGALGVSRARLYRAFADRGGVATAIRDARLNRARHAIAKRAGQRLSLEEIAAACGFTEYNTFSRAFRARFGLSPRDAQKLRWV